MIGTVPSYLHQLPPTKLGITPSPCTVHTKRMAECDDKEGTLRTHHGTYPTSSPVSATFQITDHRSQDATNETGTTGHQGSIEEDS